MQRVSVAATLFIEFAVPFLIFTTRRLRAVAGILLIGLQLLIQFTGNFTFFNLLSIALCLFCFDDAMLARIVPPSLVTFVARPFAVLHASRQWTYVFRAIAVLLVVLSVGDILPLFAPVPSVMAEVDQRLAPLRVVNSYGLFAVMTTERPELIIEGSYDGMTWLPYQFSYKAGDVTRMPPFVAPFQPRLDWQLWFEGLEAEAGAGPTAGLPICYCSCYRVRPTSSRCCSPIPFRTRHRSMSGHAWNSIALPMQPPTPKRAPGGRTARQRTISPRSLCTART